MSILQYTISPILRFFCRLAVPFRKSFFNKEEGRIIAAKYNLVDGYEAALKFGMTPDEALEEWDIYPYNNEEAVKAELHKDKQ